MSNPFDQKDSMYLVLMNNIGQYSVWPSYIDVPTGWQVVWGETTLSSCHQYIEEHWESLLPNEKEKESLSL
ncbi:MbtH family protein [Cytobacillus kochii]|uniref:MbtH family protein n=1 Tax=Cytobacillus kochii TaxID=859143 RepID=UPI0025A26C44|nr:MbtH family protein [Cytobacillus kochii]MDM5207897.1 MbtH family protein [Cytobacillus kochii]